MRRSRSRALVAAACLALSLAACAEKSDDVQTGATPAPTTSQTQSEPASEPTTQQPPEGEGTTIEVTIADGEISPLGQTVDVGVGEPITLVVTSDTEDEFHLHSDPEQEFAIEPATNQEFTFTIERPGQAVIESHELGGVVAKLVVQ